MVELAEAAEPAVTCLGDQRIGLSCGNLQVFIGVVKRTTNMEGGQERDDCVSFHAAVSIDAHGVGRSQLAAERNEFEGVSGLYGSFAEGFELGNEWAVHPWRSM